MARLIEISTTQTLPPTLWLEVGDLLLFRVNGGHVQTGDDVVERLGPYLPGTVLNNGQVLNPEGLPNTVLFLARAPGQARIDVVNGGFGQPVNRQTFELTITSY